ETLGAGGLLFTPGDASDLARQLQRLLFDERDLHANFRARGIAEASRFARARWREHFARLIEEVLDMAPRLVVERLQVEAGSENEVVAAKQRQALVAVRVTNAGSHPVGLSDLRVTCLEEGPGETPGSPGSAQPIAPVDNACGLIAPGRSVTMPLLVGVPEEPG